MSRDIDERIVSMQFDNKNFEANASETLSTLDKLEKSLQFKNASNGFSTITKAAAAVSLSGIQNGVDSLNNRFTLLGITAINALNRISNMAINAATNLAKMFTVQPVHTGLQEYETQLNSVQTILANTKSKGSTLKDVNAALDELNHYADRTIYNFTEMTRNIGTFTAAGVGLETSTKAIKGIANLAAVSGSTSAQASHAMYQLSQALATGTVRLMDWNSVVNAGMGGEVFQNALIRTAAVMAGSAKDVEGWRKANIDSYGSFRDSLTQGAWLTTEVLTNTLSQFTGDMSEVELQAQGYTQDQIKAIMDMAETANDAATKVKTFTQLLDTLKEAAQSGWTQSWEYILGDFEEAREMWTAVDKELEKMLSKSADERNAMLKEWHDNGGRDAMIRSVANSWKALLSVITPVKNAFKQVFPSITGKQLADVTKKLEKFTSGLKISGKTAAGLYNTFEGVFSAFSIFGNAISAVIRTLAPGTKVVGNFATSILTLTGNLGRYVSNLRNTLKTNDTFYKGLQVVLDAFKRISAQFDPYVNRIKASVSAIYDAFKEKIKLPDFDSSVFEIFEKLVSGIQKGVQPATVVLDKLADALDKVKEKIEKTGNLSSFFDGLANSMDYISDVGSALISVLKAIATGITNLLDGLTFDKAVKYLTSGMLAELIIKISKSLDDIEGITKKAKKLTIKDIFKDIVDSFKSLTSIDLAPVANNIRKVMGVVTDTLVDFQNKLKADALKSNAISIGILTVALYALSSLDVSELIRGLSGMAGLFGMLASIIVILDKMATISAKPFSSISTSMVAVAIAVVVLVSALKTLSQIDPKAQMNALLTVLILIGSLAKVSGKIETGQKGFIRTALGLILFAAAIKILGSSVKSLAELDMGSLMTGLIGVLALVTIVSKFLNNTDFDGMGIRVGLGLILVAEAIKVLGSSVKAFGDMNPEQLIKGLGAIVAIIAALSLFTKIASGSKKMISIGLGLVLVSAALKIMSGSVASLGSMDTGSLIKGLASIMLLLEGIAAFTALASGATKMIGIGSGLISVAYGMTIMANAVSIFGSLSLGSLVKGLVGFGAALVIISGAVLSMPMTMPIIGAGLIVMAIGMTILAGALTNLGSQSWGSMAKGLISLAASLAIIAIAGKEIGLAAPLLIFAGAALVVFSVGLTSLATVIAILGSLKLTTVIAGIIGIAAGLAILGGTASLMSTLAPAILATGFSFLVLAASIVVLGAGLSLIGSGLLMVATAIGDGTASIKSGIESLAVSVDTALNAIINIIFNALTSISMGITRSAPAIASAAMALANSFMTALASIIPKAVDCGLQIILGLLQGIEANMSGIMSTSLQIIVNFVNAIAAGIGPVIDAGINLMVSFINGMADGIRENSQIILSAVANLMSAIIEFALTALQTLVSAIPVIGEEIDSALETAKEKVRETLNPADLQEATSSAMDGAKAGIESKTPEVSAAGTNAGTGLLNGLSSKMTEAMTKGSQYSSMFAMGANGASGEASTAGSNLSSAFAGGLNSEIDLSALGYEDASQYIVGIEGSSGEVVSSTTSLADAGVSGLEAKSGNFLTAGTNAGGGYVNGVNTKKQAANTAGGAVALGAVSGANSKYHNFYSTGSYCGQGLINGIRSQVSAAASAGAAIAVAALQAAKKAAGVQSPSKEFKQIGVYCGEGMVIGIYNMSKAVANAGFDMGKSAVDGITSAVAKMSQIINKEAEVVQPTITPVLDMTEFQNGVRSISSVMGTGTIDMSSNFSSALRELINGSFQNDVYDDTNVISAISELRTDINRLGDRISQMQWVWDTGEVAGHLARPINRELGMMVSYASRA